MISAFGLVATGSSAFAADDKRAILSSTRPYLRTSLKRQPMAITNYTELQAALADYLIRSDLTVRIPDFIALCEGRLNRTLRVRDMETSFGLVMAAGSGALPGDYLEWISAQWIGPRTADLRYVEPNSEEWQRRYRPSGDPAMFTILAGALKLRPVLPGNVTLYYSARSRRSPPRRPTGCSRARPTSTSTARSRRPIASSRMRSGPTSCSHWWGTTPRR
jgi:hypothetical protein